MAKGAGQNAKITAGALRPSTLRPLGMAGISTVRSKGRRESGTRKKKKKKKRIGGAGVTSPTGQGWSNQRWGDHNAERAAPAHHKIIGFRRKPSKNMPADERAPRTCAESCRPKSGPTQLRLPRAENCAGENQILSQRWSTRMMKTRARKGERGQTRSEDGSAAQGTVICFAEASWTF